MANRKCILYIACSVDGFIAGPDDDLGFLDKMEIEGEDYGYGAFRESVDTMIVGRKTYDWVRGKIDEFPTFGLDTYVISSNPLREDKNVNFHNGSPSDLIKALKQQEGKHIFCNGGAVVIHELMQAGQIDEIILSTVPCLLESGTPLFSAGRPAVELKLVESISYESGLVQSRYLVLNNG